MTLASTATAATLCQKRHLLTSEQTADVANLVLEAYSVPLLPESLQAVLVQRAVEALAREIEAQTEFEDSEMAALVQGVLDEGLTEERVKALCDALEPSLVRSEGLPLLSPQQQRGLLEGTLRALLSPEVVSLRPLGVRAVRAGARGVDGLLDDAARARLVTAVNAKLDLPFLDEAQEQAVLGAGFEAVAAAARTVVPASLLDALRGADPVEVGDFKRLASERVGALVPALPGIAIGQQRAFVAAVVDVLFESFAQGSAVHEAAASLSPEGRLAFLKERDEGLAAELALARRGFKRREANLQRQRAHAQEEMERLLAEPSGMVFGGRGRVVAALSVTVAALAALGSAWAVASRR